ncbi:DUF1214 domain-containing protein [Mycolicibacterium baixiangningiae]|uniref:DUF1214 domain-containing protein n=1 Tax=Mycolicibacterium baixiangningiae TaxID=2761578 RepID=UPI0018CFFC80|nr:DUF1214 domain-containing protein [Mycolicibacterium baixiangningiae]
MTWNEQLEAATSAWQGLCRALEATGTEALTKTMTHDEIDLAEGLRYLSRLTQLTLMSAVENKDADHPYLWTALDPHRKMGGDNPQGLYLSAPINGTDVYRLRGNRGSARWVSILISQDGLPPFGHALFLPDLDIDADGNFEVLIAARPQPGSWLKSTDASTGVLIRQFFGTPDNVIPMTLQLDNLTTTSAVPQPLTLQPVVDRLARASLMFSALAPMMQQEMLDKADRLNTFKTDIGDPTSNAGGVPGGNAVIARWALSPDEALVVTVTPPSPCAYWDVQVGNGWYESFDYRHFFSGLTCEGAHLDDNGRLTVVVSEHDPGTTNWLETAGHRQGHIAVRWQLSGDQLPIPDTTVVPVDQVPDLTGLPLVDPGQRGVARNLLADSFDRRFGV